MLPLESAEEPLAAFAAGLRELRERAGSPPFRQMARRAHYSASTLSVACSGNTLPSRDVTLAFVQACDGSQQEWRRRWSSTAAAMAGTEPRLSGSGLRQAAAPGAPERARLARNWGRAVRHPVVRRVFLAVTSAGTALAIAGFLGAYGGAAAPTAGFGVSPCDQGSYWVRKAPVTSSRAILLNARSVPAGTRVGTVYLMYAPRCAEGWVHYSTASVLDSRAGSVTVRALSVPDNSVTTSTVQTIRTADGEPMLTVSGCVDAEATVSLPEGPPVATGTTGCFQFGN